MRCVSMVRASPAGEQVSLAAVGIQTGRDGALEMPFIARGPRGLPSQRAIRILAGARTSRVVRVLAIGPNLRAVRGLHVISRTLCIGASRAAKRVSLAATKVLCIASSAAMGCIAPTTSAVNEEALSLRWKVCGIKETQRRCLGTRMCSHA